METLDPLTLLFLVIAGFIAAFVDSVVGGGGLISLPALLATGIPVPYALGTNKLAAVFGAMTSFTNFYRAGRIDMKSVAKLMPLSFIASCIGAYTTLIIPSGIMRKIVLILLIFVAIYTLFRKDWGDVSHIKKRNLGLAILLIIMAIIMGFYDGFFGPGTGSFLMFGFLFFGYDYVFAAGNAKALNLASGLAGFATFAINGTVLWSYGIFMGISMVCGAFVGSRMAIKKGVSYVRPLFLAVTTMLILKQIYDIIIK